MKLAHYEWTARAVALEEAAEHLDSGQNWTDDRVELAQGVEVAKRLRGEAVKCRDKAKGKSSNLEFRGATPIGGASPATKSYASEDEQ